MVLKRVNALPLSCIIILECASKTIEHGQRQRETSFNYDTAFLCSKKLNVVVVVDCSK